MVMPNLIFALTHLLVGLKRNTLTLVKPNESVILFPTLSNRVAIHEPDDLLHKHCTHAWDIAVHGWVFQPKEKSHRRKALLSLLRSALHLDADDLASGILSRRLQPFLVGNAPKKALSVDLYIGKDSSETLTVDRSRLRMRSKRNGHFKGVVRLTDKELGLSSSFRPTRQKELILRVVAGKGDPREFVGATYLLPATGLSIISDIDDTVKLSNVLDKRKLLRNTFLEEFHVVPGMPELYRNWSDTFDASFHFVSASPWQLFGELSGFMSKAGFPEATFHLKSVRFKDRTVLSLLADPFQAKVRTIETIIKSFPERQFVLVGDTGEKDPEVYGELYRRYPNNVWRIFVRDVTKDSNDRNRYMDAFDQVPGEVWSIFDDASTIDLPKK